MPSHVPTACCPDCGYEQNFTSNTYSGTCPECGLHMSQQAAVDAARKQASPRSHRSTAAWLVIPTAAASALLTSVAWANPISSISFYGSVAYLSGIPLLLLVTFVSLWLLHINQRPNSTKRAGFVRLIGPASAAIAFYALTVGLVVFGRVIPAVASV